jgi:hypothetical protein
VESDLSYHQLFEGFLKTLCDKWGDPFCAEADNFARYETEPVQVSSIATKVQAKRKRIIAGFVLNKRGSIRVTLERAGVAVRAWSGSMFRGKHTLTWTPPPQGDYELVVKATSLNGIASEATSPQISIAEPSRTVRLRGRPK